MNSEEEGLLYSFKPAGTQLGGGPGTDFVPNCFLLKKVGVGGADLYIGSML